MLFMSFIITPSVMVTCIDADIDISMVFALVEEETKESKDKSMMDADKVFQKTQFPVPGLNEIVTKKGNTFFIMNLCNLYCPGEIAPPPELS